MIMSVRVKEIRRKQRQSPFLKAFQKTERVWDDTAKTAWADDVERRLREVTDKLDPKPVVRGYVIQRVKNCVNICTITPNWQTKQNMAALSAGHWPCWGEVIKAVPELFYSTVCFGARPSWEWWREWDVEDEMGRFRSEHGVYE